MIVYFHDTHNQTEQETPLSELPNGSYVVNPTSTTVGGDKLPFVMGPFASPQEATRAVNDTDPLTDDEFVMTIARPHKHTFTYNDAREKRPCSCGGELYVTWERDSPSDPSMVPLVKCANQ